MSETPTPRTDAAMCGFCRDAVEKPAVNPCAFHLIRHARQLERELAAMKAYRENEKAECDLAHKRAGDRWKMYDTEVQDHAITKRELAAANEESANQARGIVALLRELAAVRAALDRAEEARAEAVALAERLRDAMNELDADVQAERGVNDVLMKELNADGKG